jgi:Ca2+-binding RTX toxin-like protein
MSRTLLVCAGAFTALALALPTAAHAGTASIAPEGDDPGVATYVAGPGERNDVTVRYDGQVVTVHDTDSPVFAAEGCWLVDAHTAACTIHAVPLPWARASLGDGDDRVMLARGVPGPALGLIADGGAGDDVLDASRGWNAAVLDGGAGSDRLTGTRHPDLLRDGDDTGDALDGRDGADRVDYSARTGAITVDLAAGTSSTGDMLRNVEDVTGGAGDDHLLGDSEANVLDGGPSHDVLSGRGGDDGLGMSPHAVSAPGEGPPRQASSHGDSVRCGGGLDAVNARRTGEFVPGSCEVIVVPRHVPYATGSIRLSARPTASGRYVFHCSNPEDFDDPRWRALRCSGMLTLREAAGRRRLLATARIHRGREDIVAHLQWTATGRRLAGRARGIRARLSLHGRNVPHAGWTLQLHRR